MDTDIEHETPRSAVAADPGIVRGASQPSRAWWHWLMPVVAAAVVVMAHATTTRMDSWWPAVGLGGSTLPGRAFDMAAVALAGVPWPMRHGVLSLACTALAMACLAIGVRRRGLSPLAASIVALIAAATPFVWTHAVGSSGAAGVLLISAALVALSSRTAAPASRVVAGTVAVGAVVALAVTSALSSTSPWGAFSAVRGDLSGPGLVLLLLGLVARGTPQLIAALLVAAALSASLGTSTQTAAMLPWAWAIVAAGIGVLCDWRATHGSATSIRTRTGVWVIVGLVAWLAVTVASRDWRARADLSAAQHLWVRTAGLAAGDVPIVTGARSPAGVLIRAWQRSAPAQQTGSSAALVLPDAAAEARWTGRALEPLPAALASLADVLSGLPSDVIVVAGVARDAADALDAADWQALGRLGARPTAGPPRARVVVGVTGGRLRGHEATGEDRAALALLPGDLIAPTLMPSPLDLQVEAGAHTVRVHERGRVRATGDGLLVVAYRQDGRLLAAWVGAGGRLLGSGVPGDAGAPIGRLTGALPCRVVDANAPTAIDDLAIDGALGIVASPETRIALETMWAPSDAAARPRLVAGQAQVESTDSRVDLVAADTSPLGVDLRGRPSRVEIRATASVRVCAAPVLATLPRITAGRLTRIDPADSTSFARGWHDSEPLDGGHAFRWMDGTRGVLLVAADDDVADDVLSVTLDAQAIGEPADTDVVRLAVNGHAVGTLPLQPGRTLYRWEIPSAHVRAGLNELTLETTLAMRPSDLTPGADGRLLGMGGHGVEVEWKKEEGQRAGGRRKE